MFIRVGVGKYVIQYSLRMLSRTTASKKGQRRLYAFSHNVAASFQHVLAHLLWSILFVKVNKHALIYNENAYTDNLIAQLFLHIIIWHKYDRCYIIWLVEPCRFICRKNQTAILYPAATDAIRRRWVLRVHNFHVNAFEDKKMPRCISVIISIKFDSII